VEVAIDHCVMRILRERTKDTRPELSVTEGRE